MLTSEGLKSSLFSLFSLLLLQVSVSVVAAQPADDPNFDHLAACRMAGTPISVCLNQYVVFLLEIITLTRMEPVLNLVRL